MASMSNAAIKETGQEAGTHTHLSWPTKRAPQLPYKCPQTSAKPGEKL